MSPPLQVRRLKQEDIPSAAQIEASVLDGWQADSIQATLLNSPFCFFATWDDIPAGVCLCDAVLDEASLYAVSVAASFRRRGIAAALLRTLFRDLRENNIRILFLEVRKENPGAIALYESLGFVQSGLRKNFYQNPPDDAVLMHKELNA